MMISPILVCFLIHGCSISSVALATRPGSLPARDNFVTISGNRDGPGNNPVISRVADGATRCPEKLLAYC
jgi:hypothetical protein